MYEELEPNVVEVEVEMMPSNYDCYIYKTDKNEKIPRLAWVNGWWVDMQYNKWIDSKFDEKYRSLRLAKVGLKKSRFIFDDSKPLPFQIVQVSEKQTRLESKLRKVKAADIMSTKGNNSLMTIIMEDQESLEIMQNLMNDREPFTYL